MRAALSMVVVLIGACASAAEKKMTVAMTRVAAFKEPYGRHLAFGADGRWAAAEDGHFAVGNSSAVERRGFRPDRHGAIRLAGQSLMVSPFSYDLSQEKWIDSAQIHPALVAGLTAGAPAGNFEIQAAAASADGNEVVVGTAYRPSPGIGAPARWGGNENRLLVLKPRSFELLGTLVDRAHGNQWTRIAVGDRVIAAAAMDELTVFDRQSRKKLAELRKHEGPIRDLAFSRDGKWLASASVGDHRVVLWDTATWREVISWSAHDEGVLAVAFHPTRPLLATGGEDGQLKLWSLPDGTLVHGESTGNVKGLAFSPDGQRLLVATGSPQREILLFEVK